jgi:hypothetical protein
MSNNAFRHSVVAAHETETVRTLGRFGLRLVMLLGFSFLGNQDFSHALASFLVLAVLFCAGVSAVRWESPFAPTLTHWDEAAAYALIISVVHMINVPASAPLHGL